VVQTFREVCSDCARSLVQILLCCLPGERVIDNQSLVGKGYVYCTLVHEYRQSLVGKGYFSKHPTRVQYRPKVTYLALLFVCLYVVFWYSTVHKTQDTLGYWTRVQVDIPLEQHTHLKISSWK
jgi:hypothetical protein